MSGFNAIGELPIGELEDESTADAPFVAASEATQADTVYLIVIQGYRPGADTSSWIAPIGADPIGQLPDGEESVTSTVTLYFSDRYWVSDPADPTLPNVAFEGRAIEALSIDRSLPTDPTGDRQIATSVGYIDLRNEDGMLDDLIDQTSFTGRSVTVLFGKRADYFDQFGVVFSGVIASPPAPTGGKVRISVRERTFGLESSVLGVYGGTGAMDGDLEIQGQVIRECYGPVQNVTLRCINKSSLVYQGHGGAIQSFEIVRDSGEALTLDISAGTGGDCASYAALIAATIAGGKFATCLALGILRLGDAPSGAVTADFHGGKLGGVYVDTVSGIARGILTQKGSVEVSGLDVGAFDSLVGTAPGAVTVCFDDQLSVKDALGLIMQKIPSCWWGDTQDGKITVGRLTAPSLAGRRFDTLNIVGDIQFADVPDSVSPCIWRLTPGYAPNYTIQTPADLTLDATQTKIELYGRPFVTGAPVFDSNRVTREPSAKDVLIATGCVLAESAALAAAVVFDLYSPGRKLASLPVRTVVHLVDLNQPVTVVYPRFGLANGRNFVVVGIQFQASTRTGVLRVLG